MGSWGAYGATNMEAAQAWFEEMQDNVLSYQGGEKLPWASIIDTRGWDMASMDMWEKNNTNLDWMYDNHCVLCSFVFSKKVQQFAAEKGFKKHPILEFFFDFDEAYKTCLEKLTEAQSELNR